MRVLSAGIVPIYKFHDEWKFLLLRSFKYWDFPKGEVSPGEDPYHAALRELQEETGIPSGKKTWGVVFNETEPYSRDKVARYYLLEIEEEFEVKLLPNPESGIIEHHEARWVTYHDAQKLLGQRVGNILEWAANTIGRAK